MAISIYYNPLDPACKNLIGGIKQGELLELNIYLLKKSTRITPWTANTSDFNAKTPTKEECMEPKKNAFLRLNLDGEICQFYPMKKTEFGWSISIKIKEIGLYY